MQSLNSVTLIGNLGDDPEMKYTPNGKAVTTFRLATNRKYKSEGDPDFKEETSWHNVTVWGKLAETANEYLSKGDAVFVRGSIQYRSWQGQDGQWHDRTEIIADGLIFLTRKAVPAGESKGEPDDIPF